MQPDRMEKQATLREKVNKGQKWQIYTQKAFVTVANHVLLSNNTFCFALSIGNAKWRFLRKPRKLSIDFPVTHSSTVGWCIAWACTKDILHCIPLNIKLFVKIWLITIQAIWATVLDVTFELKISQFQDDTIPLWYYVCSLCHIVIINKYRPMISKLNILYSRQFWNTLHAP